MPGSERVSHHAASTRPLGATLIMGMTWAYICFGSSSLSVFSSLHVLPPSVDILCTTSKLLEMPVRFWGLTDGFTCDTMCTVPCEPPPGLQAMRPTPPVCGLIGPAW